MSQLTTRTTTDGNPYELLSITQAAEILGVNRMWLSGYLVASSIPFYTLANGIGIERQHLADIRVPHKRKRRQEA